MQFLKMYVFTIFIAADSAIITKCFYLLYTFCLLVLSFLHNISFVPLCLSWRSIFYSSNISFLGLLINIHMIVFSYFRLLFFIPFFLPLLNFEVLVLVFFVFKFFALSLNSPFCVQDQHQQFIKLSPLPALPSHTMFIRTYYP